MRATRGQIRFRSRLQLTAAGRILSGRVRGRAAGERDLGGKAFPFSHRVLPQVDQWPFPIELTFDKGSARPAARRDSRGRSSSVTPALRWAGQRRRAGGGGGTDSLVLSAGGRRADRKAITIGRVP